MTDDEDPDLPVVDPPSPSAPAMDAPADGAVAGVLLAAGTSTRFGARNKLLARLEGEPLVVHAARTLLEADLDRVVAVVGHEGRAVRAALAGLPLAVVENPAFGRGQSTSVRAGVEAVRDTDAAVFMLGDMPRVAPASVASLVAAFGAGLGDPLAAAVDGERGNPVLFGAGFYDDLADTTGDTGGRGVLLSAPDGALVETGDPGVRQTVETPDDLAGFRDS